MVSGKEFVTIERMLRIIHDEKKISYFDLIDRARISITKYSQLKMYLIDKYDNVIQYDKESKIFTSLKAIEEELENENISTYYTKENK